MIKVFALTGGIACGKSTVAKYWAQSGLTVIDADELAHQVMSRGTPAFHAIVQRFGRVILAADGSVDRKTLGRLVFSDVKARRDLEIIIHPDVMLQAAVAFRDAEVAGHVLACYDIPLLYESGLEVRFHPVVVVSTTPELQVQRLKVRSKLNDAEARVRIAAQMPLKVKVAQADYVIDNSSSLDDLYRQADDVLKSIRSKL